MLKPRHGFPQPAAAPHFTSCRHHKKFRGGPKPQHCVPSVTAPAVGWGTLAQMLEEHSTSHLCSVHPEVRYPNPPLQSLCSIEKLHQHNIMSLRQCTTSSHQHQPVMVSASSCPPAHNLFTRIFCHPPSGLTYLATLVGISFRFIYSLLQALNKTPT